MASLWQVRLCHDHDSKGNAFCTTSLAGSRSGSVGQPGWNLVLSFKPDTATASPLARILKAATVAFRPADAIVTSMNDGHHKVGSKHYLDQAADFRTWHLSSQPNPCKLATEMSPACAQIMVNLRMFLGRDYDVVFETDVFDDAGKLVRAQHLHAEYDPKAPDGKPSK